MNDNKISSKIKRAWNIFTNNDYRYREHYENSFHYRPDRVRVSNISERSIIGSVLNRISLDVSAIDIYHCRLDDKDRYKETINSSLNTCLTLSSNIDQTSRQFFRDVVLSMCDEGVVAIVPVDTSSNPNDSDSYNIHTMRVGRITTWYPKTVTVELYNDMTRT